MSSVRFDTLDFEVLLKRFYEDLRQQSVSSYPKGIPVTWLRWQDRQWIEEFEFQELRDQLKQDTHKAPRIRHFGESSLEALVDHYKQLTPEQIEQLEAGTLVSSFVPVVSQRDKKILGVLFFPKALDAKQLQVVQTAMQAWAIPLELGLEHWTAVHLSLTDDVTGLFNQRYLPQVLNKQAAKISRCFLSTSIISRR